MFFRILFMLLLPVAFIIDILLLVWVLYDLFTGGRTDGKMSFFGATGFVLEEIKSKRRQVSNVEPLEGKHQTDVVREDNRSEDNTSHEAQAGEIPWSEEESDDMEDLHKEVAPSWTRWIIWPVIALFVALAGYFLILVLIDA